jgi:membrane fusion protein (multidrug efflux system)
VETARAPAARLDAPEEQAERPADAPVSRRETPQQQPKRPVEKPALCEKAPRSSRGWSVRSALFALLPLALISGAYWYVTGGQVMSTDDAYVEADTVGISTDVPGIALTCRNVR